MPKRWEVTAIRLHSGFPGTVYMWTVNMVRASKRPSEMFQALVEKAYYCWNVFIFFFVFFLAVEPQIFFVNAAGKMWAVFVCLYQETCEQRGSQHRAAYLAMRFTSGNLFVWKNKIKKKKKRRKIPKQWRVFTQRKDSKSYLLVVNVFFVRFSPAHLARSTCAAHG